MVFIVELIVNIILLSVPIAGTLGALFAIKPFRGDRAAPKINTNGVNMTSACNGTSLYAQNRYGPSYIVNSNEATISNETVPYVCTSMKKFENDTYATNTTAPDFAFTWEYPFLIANKSSPANETKPRMHAFPQITFADSGNYSVLPLSLEDLGELNLEFKWTMGTGTENATETNIRRLGGHEVNASVALDMYLGSTETLAANPSKAQFEMIIYFANYGLQDPVGFGNGTSILTETLDGNDFELYAGKNDNDQNVFSWLATEPIEEFSADISPLFNSILFLKNTKHLGVDIPTFNEILGSVGFGTQAYNSVGLVTFWVPKLSIDIQKFVS